MAEYVIILETLTELEMIGVTLETKVDEVETLKAQLEVANEKLETHENSRGRKVLNYQSFKYWGD